MYPEFFYYPDYMFKIWEMNISVQNAFHMFENS